MCWNADAKFLLILAELLSLFQNVNIWIIAMFIKKWSPFQRGSTVFEVSTMDPHFRGVTDFVPNRFRPIF